MLFKSSPEVTGLTAVYVVEFLLTDGSATPHCPCVHYSTAWAFPHWLIREDKPSAIRQGDHCLHHAVHFYLSPLYSDLFMSGPLIRCPAFLRRPF